MVGSSLVAGVIHRPAVVVMPDMLLGLLFSGGILYRTQRLLRQHVMAFVAAMVPVPGMMIPLLVTFMVGSFRRTVVMLLRVGLLWAQGLGRFRFSGGRTPTVVVMLVSRRGLFIRGFHGKVIDFRMPKVYVRKKTYCWKQRTPG